MNENFSEYRIAKKQVTFQTCFMYYYNLLVSCVSCEWTGIELIYLIVLKCHGIYLELDFFTHLYIVDTGSLPTL